MNRTPYGGGLGDGGGVPPRRQLLADPIGPPVRPAPPQLPGELEAARRRRGERPIMDDLADAPSQKVALIPPAARQLLSAESIDCGGDKRAPGGVSAPRGGKRAPGG